MSEISDKKRDLMNRLYFAAIGLRRAQLEFCDGANVRTMKELMDCGAIVGQILTEINGGKDPVRFESRAESISATAALIAGG